MVNEKKQIGNKSSNEIQCELASTEANKLSNGELIGEPKQLVNADADAANIEAVPSVMG